MISKKWVILGGAGAVLLGLVGFILVALLLRPPLTDFQVILPPDTSVEQIDSWEKLTSPNGDTYYTYADSIDDVVVKVSEQQLPKQLQANPTDSVTEIAKGYNATRTLDFDSGKLYIGVSENGPQSVIFYKKGVLILIMSQKTIQDASWIAYANSLQ